MLARSRTPAPRPRGRARRGRRLLLRTTALTAVAGLGLGLAAAVSAPVVPDRVTSTETHPIELARDTTNPVTPGDFAGFGFDQCLAPTQKAMDTWLRTSPFLAVGIYISGKSRACRDQPNLTPTWIRNQLTRGWKLLPITLGPQASCSTRFPRYGNDPTIKAKPGRKKLYVPARKMGRTEAGTAVAEAKRLGIVPGSTLWYDLEAFDITNTNCRESAMAFLHAWTVRLHELDYVSGVYSSAGSGIKMLDDARVNRPKAYRLPDRIWVARWDGRANTSTSYIREDGWRPGNRVKQYQGGHNETWGGVTINIDRNWLEVGQYDNAPLTKRCGGVRISYRTFPTLNPPSSSSTPPVGRVKTLQCLLTEQGKYSGAINGKLNRRTLNALAAWQSGRGLRTRAVVGTQEWMSLHTAGRWSVLKIGSLGAAVRRVQLALNSADSGVRLRATGRYDATTAQAVRAYQRRVGLKPTGIVEKRTWSKLSRGIA
ncbi:glycoside hydrolase domain-containing protein [Nocardioides sambongensis]|uniref:glycoside hydrolase domain-containing protein n=1 Tax=Nocardioides sambongensis TaxID=2589074 RepID=UPI0011270154|nr:glycoside hydrolase domain-containing protein [Nocardioides sambongensis]